MRSKLAGVLCVLALAACGKSSDTAVNAPAEEATDNSAVNEAAAAVSQSMVNESQTGAPPTIEPIATAPLSEEEHAAAIAALNMPAAEAGQVVNACDEAVTPDVYAAELGGAVGRAFLVVVGGGPTTASCYGDTGMQFFLFKQGDTGLKLILSDFGHFAVMNTEHLGVKDISIGGPGFAFPVLEWNGQTFVPSRTIKEGEFPQPLN
jgi:hypothetical protein